MYCYIVIVLIFFIWCTFVYVCTFWYIVDFVVVFLVEGFVIIVGVCFIGDIFVNVGVGGRFVYVVGVLEKSIVFIVFVVQCVLVYVEICVFCIKCVVCFVIICFCFIYFVFIIGYIFV